MRSRSRITRLALVVLLAVAVLPIGTVPAHAKPVPAGSTVFRFYNQGNGSHFYTSSLEERDAVIAKYPDVFTFEGVAYYVPSLSGAGLSADVVPLHRFFNKKNKSHFYTISAEEKAFVESKLSAVYSYEGVAYQVFDGSAEGMLMPVHRFYNMVTGCHFYTASAVEMAFVQMKYPAIYRYEGVAFYASSPFMFD